VVVEDGSQAIMTVQDQVPYQEQNTDPAGNTNLTYAFTDAAITLDISPHISSDNYLRLHINQTVESFRPSIAVGEPPPKTSRQIETDIVIPDGYTVVMGGLINKIESENDEGIPFLKDIPVLGYLFSSHRQTASTTSLFLFVTPHIIRNPQNDFTEYHKISWERKLRADQLLGRTVDFYGARFKEDPDVQEDETLEKIQDSGFLDSPRLKNAPEQRMTKDEAAKRYEELTRDRRPARTTTTDEPDPAKASDSGGTGTEGSGGTEGGGTGSGGTGSGGVGEDEK
jgi:hypothetical protein